MNPIDPNLKYILYARKSSEGEDRQMASIEDQISEMQKIATRLNLNVVEIITESQSAKQPTRKGFNQMVESIYAGKADAVLCWRLNRLARNSIDGGKMIYMLTNEKVIKHIQTYSRGYKPTDNVIALYIEFGMADQFVKDLSVDVGRGTRRKAERGWNPAAQLPLGYKHDITVVATGANEIIPDSKYFDSIKLLWSKMIQESYSIAQIKNYADTLGIRSRKGNKMSKSVYHRLFTNEFYCGYFYWKDENGEPIRRKGKHKTMVSESDFQKVQARLRKNNHPINPKKYSFPYRGVIFCDECNCSITAEHKLQAICTNCKHKFSIKTTSNCIKCGTWVADMDNPTIIDKVYYHCTKRRGKCSQKGVEQTDLVKQIKKKIDEVAISEKFYDIFLESLDKKESTQASDREQLLNNLNSQKEELILNRKNMMRLRAQNEITAADWAEIQIDYRSSLNDLESEIKRLTDHAHDKNEMVKNYIAFAKEIPKIFNTSDSSEEKTKMLGFLGSNLTLKDKKLLLDLAKPLKRLKKNYNLILAQKDQFEPEITIEEYIEKEASEASRSVWRAEWDEVRTLILRDINERGKYKK